MKKIKRPLAEQILFGKLVSGGSVTATVESDDISWRFNALA